MTGNYRPLLCLSVLALSGCSDSSGQSAAVVPPPVTEHASCVSFAPMMVGELARWTIQSQKRGDYEVELYQMEEDTLRLTKTGSVEAENLMILNRNSECARYVSEMPLDEVDALLVYSTSPIQELTEEYLGLSTTPDPHTPQVFDPETDKYAECYTTVSSNPHYGGYVEVCSGDSELEGKHFQWRSVMGFSSTLMGARVVSMQLRQDDTNLLQVTLTGRIRPGETP